MLTSLTANCEHEMYLKCAEKAIEIHDMDYIYHYDQFLADRERYKDNLHHASAQSYIEAFSNGNLTNYIPFHPKLVLPLDAILIKKFSLGKECFGQFYDLQTSLKDYESIICKMCSWLDPIYHYTVSPFLSDQLRMVFSIITRKMKAMADLSIADESVYYGFLAMYKNGLFPYLLEFGEAIFSKKYPDRVIGFWTHGTSTQNHHQFLQASFDFYNSHIDVVSENSSLIDPLPFRAEVMVSVEEKKYPFIKNAYLFLLNQLTNEHDEEFIEHFLYMYFKPEFDFTPYRTPGYFTKGLLLRTRYVIVDSKTFPKYAYGEKESPYSFLFWNFLNFDLIHTYKANLNPTTGTREDELMHLRRTVSRLDRLLNYETEINKKLRPVQECIRQHLSSSSQINMLSSTEASIQSLSFIENSLILDNEITKSITNMTGVTTCLMDLHNLSIYSDKLGIIERDKKLFNGIPNWELFLADFLTYLVDPSIRPEFHSRFVYLKDLREKWFTENFVQTEEEKNLFVKVWNLIQFSADYKRWMLSKQIITLYPDNLFIAYEDILINNSRFVAALQKMETEEEEEEEHKIPLTISEIKSNLQKIHPNQVFNTPYMQQYMTKTFHPAKHAKKKKLFELRMYLGQLEVLTQMLWGTPNHQFLTSSLVALYEAFRSSEFAIAPKHPTLTFQNAYVLRYQLTIGFRLVPHTTKQIIEQIKSSDWKVLHNYKNYKNIDEESPWTHAKYIQMFYNNGKQLPEFCKYFLEIRLNNFSTPSGNLSNWTEDQSKLNALFVQNESLTLDLVSAYFSWFYLQMASDPVYLVIAAAKSDSWVRMVQELWNAFCQPYMAPMYKILQLRDYNCKNFLHSSTPPPNDVHFQKNSSFIHLSIYPIFAGMELLFDFWEQSSLSRLRLMTAENAFHLQKYYFNSLVKAARHVWFNEKSNPLFMGTGKEEKVASDGRKLTWNKFWEITKEWDDLPADSATYILPIQAAIFSKFRTTNFANRLKFLFEFETNMASFNIDFKIFGTNNLFTDPFALPEPTLVHAQDQYRYGGIIESELQ